MAAGASVVAGGSGAAGTVVGDHAAGGGARSPSYAEQIYLSLDKTILNPVVLANVTKNFLGKVNNSLFYKLLVEGQGSENGKTPATPISLSFIIVKDSLT